MPIGCSRYIFFFNLILIPQLINGGPQRWEGHRGMIAGNPPYDYPSEPDKQSPLGNSSVQQSPTYPSDCKVCTISLAVGPDSAPFVLRSSNIHLVGLPILLASRVHKYGLSRYNAPTTLTYNSIWIRSVSNLLTLDRNKFLILSRAFLQAHTPCSSPSPSTMTAAQPGRTLPQLHHLIKALYRH